MRYIADLHTHSRFSRACSPKLTLENIDAWCQIKGVDIVSTADFTHPVWFEELKKKLEPSKYPGLYQLKFGLHPDFPPPVVLPKKPTLFMLGTEIACIYSQGGHCQGEKKKVRRVHNCIYAPSLEIAEEINKTLAGRGCKLASDGRPIVGLSSKELLKIILEADKRCVLIPAHAWTPWFSIFGSYSGFDSIEECFEEMAPHIFAIETGISSDPPMNWRVSQLDNIALVSHSDIHSLPNLGREADVFEGGEKDLSYDNIIKAIRQAAPDKLKSRSKTEFKMLGTVEFIPAEGRYHYDGHRVCKKRMHPLETKKRGGICPICKKPVTVGVLSRAEELADRPEGEHPRTIPEFWGLVELDKIIAEAMGLRGRAAKSVQDIYWDLVVKSGTEMDLLLNMPVEALKKIAPVRLVEAIHRVRLGKVEVEPGYDGEYGVVKIFSEREQKEWKGEQKSLF
ncbi:MAG: endonuclease Q family protein [bacterium]|nr:endonuclease Q family protein [bacterium]